MVQGKHDLPVGPAMKSQLGGVLDALGWPVLPLVAALLGSAYHRTINDTLSGGADPHDWGWLTWVLLAGPLFGYGFLAGATLGLPDDHCRRGVWAWLARRSVWVAIGPWLGFVVWSVVYFGLGFLENVAAWAYPARQEWTLPSFAAWQERWAGWLFLRAVTIGVLGSLAYGWLVVALAALRRARRLGRLGPTFRRGLAVALGFVGSLFGTFWAVTEFCRSYFFDPRKFPILIAAASLALTAGCAATVTYGEVRRRELFQALLMAWLLGLALCWRWWSRGRAK
jgi:hypothetical protein